MTGTHAPVLAPAVRGSEARIMDLIQVRRMMNVWRLRGDRIVFTNGCFDILHQGHVQYLEEAAALGHRLVIGLNSDASVKRLGKAPDRPLNDQQSRGMVLGALRCVDAVVVFEEDTPLELITALKPDVLVKGGDWKPDQIIGSEVVLAYGGSVRSLSFVQGFSTTALVEKIKNG